MSPRRASLVLYRCPPFAAWLTVGSCTALRSSERPPPRFSRLHDPDLAHLSPCLGCPGVVELRQRRVTPAPRRLPVGA